MTWPSLLQSLFIPPRCRLRGPRGPLYGGPQEGRAFEHECRVLIPESTEFAPRLTGRMYSSSNLGPTSPSELLHAPKIHRLGPRCSK
eukprot:9148270-Pyramimonas_sp.AAC.1